jgi:UPF0716 family protein affecting phage T7 exclusion
MTPIFIIVLPLLLVVAIGLVGSTRRLGFWWTVLLSVVLTPIGGFLVAVLSGARSPRRTKRPPAPALAESATAAAAAVSAAAAAAAASAAAPSPDSTVAAYIVAPPQA